MDSCWLLIYLVMRGRKSTTHFDISVLSGDTSGAKVLAILPCCVALSVSSSPPVEKGETLHAYIARFRITAKRVEEHVILLPEPVLTAAHTIRFGRRTTRRLGDSDSDVPKTCGSFHHWADDVESLPDCLSEKDK